jgi:hypothetical protein
MLSGVLKVLSRDRTERDLESPPGGGGGGGGEGRR